jgi:hypothetical protein
VKRAAGADRQRSSVGPRGIRSRDCCGHRHESAGCPVESVDFVALSCLVLGKFGIREAPPIYPGLCARNLTLTSAHAIVAPVLYHVQWGAFLIINAAPLRSRRTGCPRHALA